MNILVVDDDVVIKRWLIMLLNQLDMYEKCIFDASDGIHALEICKSKKIDLLISDIRMPRMDGLELLEQVKRHSPHTRFAVLSSYDDFTYVRKALKIGALDYVPKADMKLTDISALLEKTLNDFCLEQTVLANAAPMQESANKQKSFEEYLKEPKPGVFPFVDSEDPSISAADLCIAIFSVYKKDTLSSIPAICESALRDAGRAGDCLPWPNGFYVLLYPCGSCVPEYQKEEYLRLFMQIDNDIEKYCSTSIEYGINVFCRSGEQIRDTFYTAMDTLEKKYYYSMKQIPPPNHETAPHTEALRSIWFKTLQGLLEQGEYSAAIDKMRSYIAESHRNYTAPFIIRKNCAAVLYVLMANRMMTADHNNVERLDQMLSSLKEADTCKKMNAWMENFSSEYLSSAQTLSKKLSPNIRAAVRYINENYPHKLTLESISRAIYLNRTYLSQQFKDEIGCTIPKYLEQIRINYALLLLRSSNTAISDISEQVGFSNQNYFSKVFKDVTGVTPMQYRKKA